MESERGEIAERVREVAMDMLDMLFLFLCFSFFDKHNKHTQQHYGSTTERSTTLFERGSKQNIWSRDRRTLARSLRLVMIHPREEVSALGIVPCLIRP